MSPQPTAGVHANTSAWPSGSTSAGRAVHEHARYSRMARALVEAWPAVVQPVRLEARERAADVGGVGRARATGCWEGVVGTGQRGGIEWCGA